ncbi:uncharacterized protein [Rutidosis leptorrhynchoides]|uniref:uncharacterized protein n=1 Tax=Rutidosis leptorrhynchoides TaxID=125765 RepID=UPI003A9A2614
MKILSMNIHGFCKYDKFESKINWFRRIRLSELPHVVAIQESKCAEVLESWIEHIWGSFDFGFIQKPKVGNSGGMFLIWDTTTFNVTEAVEDQYFLTVKGKWRGKNTESIIVNVYGPHNDEGKIPMWNSIENLMNYKDVEWVICGDFNEVRYASERMNCEFVDRRAARFNDFIDKMLLIEIPLIVKRFTRISDDGVKLSKLDRFLVSENFIQTWGDIYVIALDLNTSDHCPMVLRDKNTDFGPKPFRIFDSWFKNKEVEKIIVQAWSLPVTGSRGDFLFRNRLKNFKEALRSRSHHKYGSIDKEIEASKKTAL